MKAALGWVLISSPFVGLTVVMLATGGIGMAATVWGAVLAVVGVLFAGMHLIDSAR